jgi:hypothetical protein
MSASSRPVEEVAREIAGDCLYMEVGGGCWKCDRCADTRAIASALRAAVDAERAEASEMRAALERIAAVEYWERPRLECDNPMHSQSYNGRGDDWRCERCSCSWYDSARGMASAPPQSVIAAIAAKALLPRGVDVDERKQGRDL